MRTAITDAEANANAPTVDQIQFNPSVAAVDLTYFLPDITEPLTINGPGATSLNVRRSSGASGTFGFLLVDPSSAGYTVTIRGLTLSGADSTTFAGGAVQKGGPGTLALDSVVITGNTGSQAPGIYQGQGLTTISNSALTNNSAAELTDGFGGGIEAVGGELRIVNSTLDNNSAARFGAAVYANGAAIVRILSSTITHNTADFDADNIGDGALYNAGSTQFKVANTLIAGNLNGGTGDAQCSGDPFASGGYNLRSATDPGCSGFGAPGDFVNALPKIAAVPATNGGATPNIALLSGSPAINAGNPAALGGAYPACPAKDQRGLFRGGVAGTCDIGSYEFNASSTPPATGGGSPPPPTTAAIPAFDLAAAIKKCKKKFRKGPKRKKCIKRAKRRAQA